MGADRRGPLAAFIILAVIAVILLVTSVRSQAAPGWFRTTVVAGPATEPHLWGVTGKVTQVVQDGVVLVRKAAADTTGDQESTVESLGVSTTVVPQQTGHTTSPARHQVTATSQHHHPASTPHHSDPPPLGPIGREHGRHLGWWQLPGREDHSDAVARADVVPEGVLPGDVLPSEPADPAQESAGSSHRKGHAWGHDHPWRLTVGGWSHRRGH